MNKANKHTPAKIKEKIILVNRRAHYDYQILDKLVAGIVLSGAEVKSLRLKHGSLTGSYVQIIQGEAVLLGAQINPYAYADNRDYDPAASRRLLLRKSELYRLGQKLAREGLSLIPLHFFWQRRKIKLMIGLARGKKQFEKRQKIRDRDLARSRQHGED